MLSMKPRGYVEITPVLVLDALAQRVGDGRRGAEIHVRDAHADLDAAFAEQAQLAIEFDRVSAEAE